MGRPGSRASTKASPSVRATRSSTFPTNCYGRSRAWSAISTAVPSRERGSWGPVHAELTLPESPSPYAEHTFEAEGRAVWQTHRIEARAGGPLDVLIESPYCSYRHTSGVLTVRLRGGGVLLDDEMVGCSVRVQTEAMPGDEAQIEVLRSTPGTYRVTSRVPR